MSLTTDRNDEGLNKAKADGQNETYLVLSEEERAKGFIRPVRKAYVHMGRKYEHGLDRILAKPEVMNGKTYVALVKNGDNLGSRYITQKELDEFNRTGGYIGGCGTLTAMALPLAETYARDPSFYGATFCCGCKQHLPVGEFYWDGTNEKVGS